jgi:hypothetical protein
MLSRRENIFFWGRFFRIPVLMSAGSPVFESGASGLVWGSGESFAFLFAFVLAFAIVRLQFAGDRLPRRHRPDALSGITGCLASRVIAFQDNVNTFVLTLSSLTFQKNREDFTEKTSVTQPRKGLEGRGAFFASPGAKNGAKRNPAKPGFRHEVPEMRLNFLKIFVMLS